MFAGAGYVKGPRPTPAFAHPLWRGCLFCVAPGWHKGVAGISGLGGPGFIEEDTITRVPGIVDGSIGAVYSQIDAGSTVSAGSSLDRIRFNDPNSYWNLGSLGSYSLACLYRYRSTANPGTRIFGKRAGGFTDAGWDLAASGAGLIQAEWSDGTGDQTLLGTTTISTTQTLLVVVTHTGTGGVGRMYVNGILEASLASTMTPGNNTEPITFFGLLSQTPNVDAEIAFAAHWNRAIDDSALALYTNPYCMFGREL